MNIKTISALALLAPLAQGAIHVSPSGKDSSTGTEQSPVASPRKALELSVQNNDPVIIFADGTYHLDHPLTLKAKHSGSEDSPRTFKARNEGKAILSAGEKIAVVWEKGKEGLFHCTIPKHIGDLHGRDGMFITDQQPRLARFPNYDRSARWLKGASAEAFSPRRIKTWEDPRNGFVHSMHHAHWGGNHWKITGKKSPTECTLKGGWMNNRGGRIHPTDRYVENVIEELDTLDEWFLDPQSRKLTFKPRGEFKEGQGTITLAKHESCVRVIGDLKKPAQHITFEGISFRHTTRTFMKTKEPLLRSDWRIYRNGAVYLNGAKNITVKNCEFTELGGNAYFASGYNRNHSVTGCHFHQIGAGALNFIGLTTAVHNPMYDPYGRPIPFDQINIKDKGPKTNDYPAHCIASDCLIHDIGLVEKQVAGLQISVAHNITGRHLSIYDVPRAGINISENAFGGHLIEHCDIFDTVQESSDHGSFNSWGRDRFWHTNYPLVDKQVAKYPKLPLIDMLDRNVIRNSRWRCDHGWDIDLDDGSSGYIVENNLCLGGGIKLREGYHRIVRNNLVVANTFHPHVWFKDCQDQVYANIWATPYEPIQNRGKGKLWDKNIHLNQVGLKKAQTYGVDSNAVTTSLTYRNPDKLDYSFEPNAACIKVGFKPFDLTKFGVQKPSLKKIARTPHPAVIPAGDNRSTPIHTVAGAKIKNVETLGEVSATGLPDKDGVLFANVSSDSFFAKAGLKNNDVIRALNGKAVKTCSEFLYAWSQADGPVNITLWRSQKANPHKLPLFPGTVLLAADAHISGTQTVYDTHKKYIGRWSKADTILRWSTKLKPKQKYNLLIDQAHPEGFSHTYHIVGMKDSQQISVFSTGAWETFQLVSAPKLCQSQDNAAHTIKIVPGQIKHERGAALMNFKALFLIEK